MEADVQLTITPKAGLGLVPQLPGRKEQTLGSWNCQGLFSTTDGTSTEVVFGERDAAGLRSMSLRYSRSGVQGLLFLREGE